MSTICRCCGHDNAVEREAQEGINEIRDWLDAALPTASHLVDDQIKQDTRRNLWRKQAGTADKGAWS